MEYQEPNINAVPSDVVDLENIYGIFPQITATPTWTPRRFIEQFAIYKNGGTFRFYIWDSANKAWRYASLT